MKTLLKKTLGVGALVAGLVAAGASHAELSLQSGQAKISWGGQDSLDQAKAVMYHNSSLATTTRTVQTITTQPSSNNQYNSTNLDNANWNNPSNYYYANSAGALVLDALTGQVIYEKNADIARPIASITKVMTALVVSESRAGMDDILTIDWLDFKTPKKSNSDRLKVGDQLNRAEMLLMMLMKSENPAAKALARTDPFGYDGFMNKMNQKARELGMTQTVFYDPSGLDARNVASPRDLAILARHAYKHNLISQFSTTPNREFYVNNTASGFRSIAARSTNYMVRDGLYNIGFSKTGFIREAGNCVMFETTVNGRPSIVVLLGAPDSKTRWQDAENIIANLSMRRFT
ncbi:peptidase S11, D-alanyl-D-alanine carboxypeptidase 1 [Moraxella macacae 0408225]|uniref:Peptidase S11, D-alanyl-D-alanine carboxypeptidase 1 n=1 Tax=Moraxella macacae 0408225 TaxID=1230338 RepID=L2F4X2_9GAMM|nr:serine hydrolase [Moraxella macacae]ELA08069.1 peptidase S11, D-alanyl-D-alanine carboxypeptidase 1 [Moraxella macacae 0408225]